MDYRRNDMKFIVTKNKETAHKLRYEKFTEIPSQNKDEFVFLNDGAKLNFDVEKFDGVYTNVLCI